MYSSALWPLVVYSVVVVLLVAGILVLSWVLGQRHHEASTGRPYESGVHTTGSARVRYEAKFYLIAMFLVIFDLEAAFIFAWAVALRELGWSGYLGMLLFIAVLVAGLAYLWRMRALEWHTGRPRLGPGRRGREANRIKGEVERGIVVRAVE